MIYYIIDFVPLVVWQVAWLIGFGMLSWQVLSQQGWVRLYWPQARVENRLLSIPAGQAGGAEIYRQKKYIRLVLFLVIISIPLGYCGYKNQRRWGIITEPTLAIYVGPGNTYPIKSELVFLTDVCIKREYTNELHDHDTQTSRSVVVGGQSWFYIETDQVSGWVPADKIREYRV